MIPRETTVKRMGLKIKIAYKGNFKSSLLLTIKLQTFLRVVSARFNIHD